MSVAFEAIVKMACAVAEWTSSIAKFVVAEAFVGFAIVLGNCVGIVSLLLEV